MNGPASTASASPGSETDLTNLSMLGQQVNAPADHVECFPAPAGLTLARASTDELQSYCPLARQPDISSLVIEYQPNKYVIESKSLKMYLWKFRDQEIFAEALAAEIAEEIMTTVAPKTLRVHLTQRPRGGITLEAIVERHSA
jgi:7-cyano-7-deazaguanine reductase